MTRPFGKYHDHILVRAMRNPHKVSEFGPADWSAFLSLARNTALLPRFSAQCRRLGIWAGLPEKVQAHLDAAESGAEFNRTRLLWEVDRIRRAFWNSGEQIILLKGGAYAFLDLSCAKGRLSSDIDILVPRRQIEAAEERLKAYGWESAKQQDYDQKYYRQWMHELPPLRHDQRGTYIDVHHAILPPTSRLKPDPGKLISNAVSVDETFATLSPEDMVLHSAVHLYHDGDLAGSLRDVLDMHEMLMEFGGKDQEFWARLPTRAAELGLGRPLYYCCRYAMALFETPIPDETVKRVEVFGPYAPVRWIMDRLAMNALVPDPLFEPRAGRGLACFLLYMRSHWLRMPPLLLARHLTTKAVMRFRNPLKSAPTQELNQPAGE